MILAKIQRLYRVEMEAREAGMDPAVRQELRVQQSRPLLTSIRKDLDRLAALVLPKSAVGKAVAYTLSLWTELTRYVDDGHLAIDNNTAARAMRGVAVGRKNRLFCGSESGGQRAAVIYSLIESCKRAGVEPFENLRDVLERIAEESAADLTPGAWQGMRAKVLAAALRA